MRVTFLIAVLMASLTLVSIDCQAFGSYAKTGIVPSEERVPIQSGQSTGAWKGRDLSVDFHYSRGQNSMDLSGRVEFAFFMTNGYTVLHDFRLTAVFLDENGRVLNTEAITTQRGDLDPFPFHKTVVVPPGAAFISFGYQGEAIDGGHGNGGAKYFWYYPVS